MGEERVRIRPRTTARVINHRTLVLEHPDRVCRVEGIAPGALLEWLAGCDGSSSWTELQTHANSLGVAGALIAKRLHQDGWILPVESYEEHAMTSGAVVFVAHPTQHEALHQVCTLSALPTVIVSRPEDVPLEAAVLVVADRMLWASTHAVAWERRIPLLVGEARDRVLQIGPLVIPEQTACLSCLERRSQIPTNLPQPGSTSPHECGILYGMLLGEAARIYNDPYTAASAGWVTLLRLDDLVAERHRLLRDPQCERCGHSYWRAFAARSGGAHA